MLRYLREEHLEYVLVLAHEFDFEPLLDLILEARNMTAVLLGK